MGKYFGMIDRSSIDWTISLVAWLLALVCARSSPISYGIIAATSLNLLHQRYVLFAAGREFVDRVRDVLSGDLSAHGLRIGNIERQITDVKEAQIKISGAFRGRGT